jgi:hypothetical protein
MLGPGRDVLKKALFLGTSATQIDTGRIAAVGERLTLKRKEPVRRGKDLKTQSCLGSIPAIVGDEEGSGSNPPTIVAWWTNRKVCVVSALSPQLVATAGGAWW